VKDYTVIKGFKGSRTGATVEEFVEGKVVQLDGDLEKVAIDNKWVKPSKGQAPQKTEKVSIDDDRVFKLVDAIRALELDNKEHWTNSGAPECAALADLTGSKVSAAERDAAYQYFIDNKNYL